MPKQKIELCADFETLVPELNPKYDTYREMKKDSIFIRPPEVYSWGIVTDRKYAKKLPQKDIWKIKPYKDLIGVYGIGIYSFLIFICSIEFDAEVVFNNLKNFDGHFILPALSNIGFKRFRNDEERRQAIIEAYHLDEADEWFSVKLRACWKKMLPFEFSELANNNAQIYSINLSGATKKRNKGIKSIRKQEIKDNLVLFKGSIENFGKDLAQYAISSGMSEKWSKNMFYKKQLLDKNGKAYQKRELYKSIEELEQDGNELSYLLQDCFILYKYRRKMEKVIEKKYWHLTAGSTAFHEFLRISGDKIFQKNIKNFKRVELKRGGYKYETKSGKLLYDYEIKENLAKSIIPVRWMDQSYGNQTIHSFLSQNFYSGGLSWVNEDYRGILKPNVRILDITSAHPNSMAGDNLYPIGKAHLGNRTDYGYKLYKIEILKPLINNNGLPFLYDFRNEKREYLTKLKRGCIVYCDSNEYSRFLKYYVRGKKDSFKTEILFSFKAIKGSLLFGDYVAKWIKVKEEAKETGNVFMESFAKLMLNSLYGKFGTKTIRHDKVWDSDNLEWISSTEINDSEYYLPWAICTTSLTRMNLVDAVGNHYDQVVGGDTDSIFWIGDLKSFKGDIGKGLGKYVVEYSRPYNFFMRRPKQYIAIDFVGEKLLELWKEKIPTNEKEKIQQKAMIKKYSKSRKIAFAGINLDVDLMEINLESKDLIKNKMTFFKDLNFYDFMYGRIIPRQLQPLRIYAYGIILDEIEKEIKPLWSYKPLTEQKNINFEDFKKNNKKYWNKYFKVVP